MIGVEPLRVDILTGMEGLTFVEAWPHRELARVRDLLVPVISKADLIRNKSRVGREKDLHDLRGLRRKASETKPKRRKSPRRRP